jgi:hypothetical protein
VLSAMKGAEEGLDACWLRSLVQLELSVLSALSVLSDLRFRPPTTPDARRHQ